jgi:hypothetical protein
VGKPDGDQGTKAGTLPVAGRMQMSIAHHPYAEILHQRQPKRALLICSLMIVVVSGCMSGSYHISSPKSDCHLRE